MKKQRDVKFIIYQSLYIFVVCVIAIKGASLDLVQVIEDDGKPKVFLTPEEYQRLLDSLKKLTYIDTNKFAVVDKDLLKENEKLQQLVQLTQQRIQISATQPQITFTQPETKIEEKKEEIPVEKKEEIVLGEITLVQYRDNIINNRGGAPITVLGTVIPPYSSKTVRLGGENTVTITSGSVSKTVSTIENKKPIVRFQRLTTMDANTKVTTLQRNVGYRVTIEDDYPGQLDVKFNGPVSVKQVSENVFDVTLNAFTSRNAFDNYTENKTEPYSIGFTVTVSDKIAPHKITSQNSFYFGYY